MNEPNTQPTRRDLLETTGKAALASALAGVAIPAVHAAGDDIIRVALVGCGGRGTGAAANALSTKQGPVKLVAMADVFADKLGGSHRYLKEAFPASVDVPEQRRFISFDGYKQALDCLKPGDIAIFATPPAFRWVHFGYAIDKGLHVFMEKPVTVDGPTTRKMFDLADRSVKAGLKVGVGLMCRHCAAREQLYDRIKKGAIGDILLLRAYRMVGPTATEAVKPNPGKMSELLYQIRHFHGFLWASGGCYSDFLIHNIDECCWMKDAWPVEAQASGGRHYRGDCIDQNFDTYSVEYTFADGTKLQLEGRNIRGCKQQFASYAHGTKGCAVISTSSHFPAKCRIHKGQRIVKEDEVWRFPGAEPDPYQREWEHLMDAIRNNKPYNEARRGAEASLVTSMGRMAAHTGQAISYQQMLACTHEFAPEVASLKLDGPAPLRLGPDNKYPVPEPGIKRDREY
jgi:predicted dehydrogenase